jgi:glycosyltransferase involved in cell wall biosynthesis
MKSQKKIAVLCNYTLDVDRVGGMDYFFWNFDEICKANNISIDWFFPNKLAHGGYKNLTIYASNQVNVENYFVKNSSLNKSEYSYIITHFVELCTYVFKEIKQKSHAKIICVDHNPRPIKGYSFKKKITKKIKGFLYAKYIDLFVGVSNYTSNEIFKDFGTHLKSKTITIHNGVVIDEILVRKERNFQNPTFLVASHLRASKGIQDLIAAINLLPKYLKTKIKVDVYGDGPYKATLLGLIEKYGLKPNITFKGNVANLNNIYYLYDYMLQPTHMECFSLSILESLAANVPVVTTNVGGNEEVIQHKENGFIFDAGNIKEFCTILENILTAEIKITAATRNLIETSFSLNEMVKNHFKLVS